MRRNAWIVGLQTLVLTLALQTAQAEELALAVVEKVVVPRIYQVDGDIEAANASTISAQTSGQVTQVLFDVDDLVNAGDVIVRIEPTEQKASFSQAEANLKSAQARLANAQKEFRRIREVYEKQVVSKSVMDKASSDLVSARAGVDAARAARVQAERQLEYTEVRAPYTGIVTERLIEVGEVVSAGRQLMSGIALEQLRVNLDVPQSIINAVRREKTEAVLINGRMVKATRLVIFPVADTATDSFRVRLDLPSGVTGVFPGMYVKVALGVGKREVLALPAQSIVYRSEVVGAYTLDADGRVRMRHVRVGNPLADGRLVVLSGLDAGEQVALDPQAAVRVLIRQRREQAGNE